MADVVQAGQPPLRREQKIGFVLLLIFAVVSIALGLAQIRNTMYRPFALNNTVPSAYKDEVTGIDALRFRDTDGDGLNDFDELYIYGSSPYLADTDSDGLTDKQEIDRGTNPSCPTGRDCANPIISGQGMLTAAVVSTTAASASAPPQAPDVLRILRDPKQLRPLLVQSGMKKDLLDKISDADLILLVNQLLASTSTAGVNLQSILNPISTNNAAR